MGDMLLTNHTLTGLVLSRATNNPWILAPAAFASHLALDSLPHFGVPQWPFKSRPWMRLATTDNLIALSFFIGFLIYQPDRWLQTTVGVFFATLPDLLFLPDVFLNKPVKNAFTRFHSHVQWSESISGGIVEAAWVLVMLYLLHRGL
jgi:hypothetical protein